MRSVSLDEAYREACQALGETIVRERLLTAELSRRDAAAQAAEANAEPPSEADAPAS